MLSFYNVMLHNLLDAHQRATHRRVSFVDMATLLRGVLLWSHSLNITQTAVSQSDKIKPDRQREIVIMLSDRSREIIRLFEELRRKRHPQAGMNETKGRFLRSKGPF
jgi:hypothetical protein